MAVLDSVPSGDWSAGLADFIEAGLQREGVATYDRRFLRLLLSERQLSRSGGLDLKSVRQAQLPAVDLLVRGEVHPTASNSFSLTLEAVRAADAVLAVSLHAQGRYPQDWLPTLERLLQELSGRLRESPAANGKAPRAHPITWMPEASLWLFRGLDCYAQGDYPQAVVAFAKARRWDRHFRLAWLWEARSYQRLGLPAPARRVLQAAHLEDKPLAQVMQRPVLAVIPGKGITAEEKEAFIRQLANSGRAAVLDPRWIGASAREADLQLSGEVAARTAARNVWLVVEQAIFLERAASASGEGTFRARQQDVLSGRIGLRAEAAATTDGLRALAQQFLERTNQNERAGEETPPTQASATSPLSLPLTAAERELARCLARVRRAPAEVRPLLAAADACLAWECDVLDYNGQAERGVEWRVREEFLAQAVASVRRQPEQKDASFWLASALWRQRYTPEYGLWAGSASGTPLREQMKPLLELFPRSAEATNLAEKISENVVHNRRSLPADSRFLQPSFPAETATPTAPTRPIETPEAEANREQFRAAVYQQQWQRAALLFSQLALAGIPVDQYEQDLFLKARLQDKRTDEGEVQKLEAMVRTPEVPAETRFATAYELANLYYRRGDFFHAVELLREIVADESSAAMALSRTDRNTTTMQDAAFTLLKHARLFGDRELDFGKCCGAPQPLPAADPAAMEALEKLFQECLSLALILGPPNAEKLARHRAEMNRVENTMVQEYRDVLPAFLQRKLQQCGPGPETMGLCSRLGSKALLLLPELVAGVCQHGNASTQCNALNVLSRLGQPAACALPVVLLALENDGDAATVQASARAAAQRLGVAPRRSVPYLARLLYHPNPVVAATAAAAVCAAAGLPADRNGLSEDEFLERVQSWWENTGSWQDWEGHRST